ncbi:MAG TPA: DUF1641 domain-containing protein [Bacillaceae bacterium]
MAKAIKKIEPITLSPEEMKQQELAELGDALLKHKDAVLETLNVIGAMHERGILELLSGLFGQGEKVLHILVKAADKPENMNTIKNLLLMMGTMGMINVKQLEPLLLKLNSGIARVAETRDNDEEKTGFLDLARALKDKEINRSVTLLLNFLKGMGEETEHLEKNTNAPKAKHRQTGETQE